MRIPIIFCIFALSISIAVVCQGQASPVQSVGGYSVVSRAANSEVLAQTIQYRSPSGKTISEIHHVTRIATGLNYWNGQWTPSEPSFHISPDGQYAYANKLQTKVRLSADLATSNSVSITTPDGIVLNSTPVAVVLYDAASGSSLILASITNCSGTLISSNQVLYKNCFAGLSGDILYTLQKSSFSQDVIWKQNIDPADYNFPKNSTRIQIFSTFNSSKPQRIARPLYVEKDQAVRSRMVSPDFIDHTLHFGKLQFGPGRAFLTTATNRFGGALIAKDFQTISGQSYLIESVRYTDVKKELQSLPRTARHKNRSHHREEVAKNLKDLMLRMPLSTARATFAVKSRENTLAEAYEIKGLIADYVALPATEPDPMVFQGDTTYFVDGLADFDNVVFEGGTVIKYPNDTTASVEVDGNLSCDTSAYLPAIFTAADDDSIGQSMSGIWGGYSGTVQPGGYANPSLDLEGVNLGSGYLSSVPIKNFRFCFAQQACVFSANFNSNVGPCFQDCQILNCGGGVLCNLFDYSFVSFANCLIANVNSVAYDSDGEGGNPVYFYNSTFDNCSAIYTCLAGTPGDIGVAVNSIFSNSSLDAGLPDITNNGTCNGFYNCGGTFGTNAISDGISPYETVGGGSYYLTTNCVFHGVGTTNIDPNLLAELAQRTTWPPIVYDQTNISSLGTLGPQAPRDISGTLDLGYHYDCLDYVFGGCNSSSNLTATTGTAIGAFDDSSSGLPYGIDLNNGGGMTFEGDATEPCVFAVADMAQEGGNGNWIGGEGGANQGGLVFNGSSVVSGPLVSATFTKWIGDHFRNFFTGPGYGAGAGAFRNCEFYNSVVSGYGIQYLTFTNCLFIRPNFTFWDGSLVINFTNENCTYYNGELALARESTETGDSQSFWSIENTIFDGTLLVYLDNYNGSADHSFYEYNAYNTNNPSWQTYGFPYSNWTQTNTLENFGSSDLLTTNYNWESSWFGDFYLPTNSLLIQKGSTNANFLGLYHFTTQTNQTIEGTNKVTMGYQYVAADADGNPLDTDGDGIPDYVEDGNGDGIYDAGDLSNWLDYYNGMLPALTIVSGNYQCGAPGSLLPISLTVQITDTNGVALTNAPITFSVTNGELELLSNGSETNSLTLRTDPNGIASVYYVLPSETNLNCFVTATALSTTNSVTVTFKEHVQTASIAAGDFFALYLEPDGKVLAWGTEILGGVDGDSTNVPCEIPGFTNIVKICAGEEQALALGADGTVWTWGYIEESGGTEQILPIQVTNICDVVDLAANDGGAVAVEGNGSVWGWGNFYADGNVYLAPTNVPGITNACATAAGDSHVLVLLNNGTVISWGQNWDGQLGDGDINDDDSFSPVAVTNLINIRQIAAGYDHSLAVDSNGIVWAWGDNSEGELGLGTAGIETGSTDAPVQVMCLSNVVQVAGGYESSMAVDSAGNPWQWGEFAPVITSDVLPAWHWAGFDLAFLDGSTNLPTQVPGISDIVSVKAGGQYEYFFALAADGWLFSWGGQDGSDYDLGYGVTSTSNDRDNSSPNSVYFDPTQPELEILQGNLQTAVKGLFLPEKLAFSVTDHHGNPIPGAPVYVQVVEGDLLVSTNDGAEQFPDILLEADTNGQVEVSAYAFDAVNTNCIVNAYAATPDGGLGLETNFQVFIVTNVGPTVTLTSPTNGSVFLAGTNIDITAIASGEAGIAQVQFFEGIDEFFPGTNSLGMSTSTPYSITVTNPAIGKYSLTAVAIDNAGLVATSLVVNITVGIPPTVSLTSPANNEVFPEGSNILLIASDSDVDGVVTQIEFFEGSTSLGFVTNSPYAFDWVNPPPGNYALTARAIDNNGLTAVSQANTAFVDIPPTVTLLAPTNPTTISAESSIALSASASDADGIVTQVQFFQGTTSLGVVTNIPYSAVWSNIAAGSYGLTAVASDNLGITSTSAVVDVTVDSSPTVTITSPSNSAFIFPGYTNVTLTATTSDTGGTITQVEFFQGTTSLGTVTTAPYSLVWSNAPPGSYNLMARATDNNGLMATSSVVSITIGGVYITSPVNFLVATAPATIPFSAAVFDNSSISQVQYFSSAMNIGTATTAPYNATWSNVSSNVYSLTAHATDTAGRIIISTPITVIVDTDPNNTYQNGNEVSDWVEYLEGADPFLASIPDTNGIVDLQVYTPLH
jgi:alpha-tubulin suppressor-like RCC1 family protein